MAQLRDSLSRISDRGHNTLGAMKDAPAEGARVRRIEKIGRMNIGQTRPSSDRGVAVLFRIGGRNVSVRECQSLVI